MITRDQRSNFSQTDVPERDADPLIGMCVEQVVGALLRLALVLLQRADESTTSDTATQEEHEREGEVFQLAVGVDRRCVVDLGAGVQSLAAALVERAVEARIEDGTEWTDALVIVVGRQLVAVLEPTGALIRTLCRQVFHLIDYAALEIRLLFDEEEFVDQQTHDDVQFAIHNERIGEAFDRSTDVAAVDLRKQVDVMKRSVETNSGHRQLPLLSQVLDRGRIARVGRHLITQRRVHETEVHQLDVVVQRDDVFVQALHCLQLSILDVHTGLLLLLWLLSRRRWRGCGGGQGQIFHQKRRCLRCLSCSGVTSFLMEECHLDDDVAARRGGHCRLCSRHGFHRLIGVNPRLGNKILQSLAQSLFVHVSHSISLVTSFIVTTTMDPETIPAMAGDHGEAAEELRSVQKDLAVTVGKIEVLVTHTAPDLKRLPIPIKEFVDAEKRHADKKMKAAEFNEKKRLFLEGIRYNTQILGLLLEKYPNVRGLVKATSPSEAATYQASLDTLAYIKAFKLDLTQPTNEILVSLAAIKDRQTRIIGLIEVADQTAKQTREALARQEDLMAKMANVTVVQERAETAGLLDITSEEERERLRRSAKKRRAGLEPERESTTSTTSTTTTVPQLVSEIKRVEETSRQNVLLITGAHEETMRQKNALIAQQEEDLKRLREEREECKKNIDIVRLLYSDEEKEVAGLKLLLREANIDLEKCKQALKSCEEQMVIIPPLPAPDLSGEVEKLNETIAAQKQKIEAMELTIANGQKQLVQLQSEKSTLNSQLQQYITAYNERMQQIALIEQTQKEKLLAIEAKERDTITATKKREADEKEAFEKLIAQHNEAVRKLKEESQTNASKIQALTQQLTECRRKEDVCRLELGTAKDGLRKCEAEKGLLNQSMIGKDDEIERLEKARQALMKQLEETRTTCTSGRDASVIALQKQIDTLTEELLAERGRTSEAKKQKETWRVSAETLRLEVTVCREDLARARERLTEETERAAVATQALEKEKRVSADRARDLLVSENNLAKAKQMLDEKDETNANLLEIIEQLKREKTVETTRCGTEGSSYRAEIEALRKKVRELEDEKRKVGEGLTATTNERVKTLERDLEALRSDREKTQQRLDVVRDLYDKQQDRMRWFDNLHVYSLGMNDDGSVALSDEPLKPSEILSSGVALVRGATQVRALINLYDALRGRPPPEEKKKKKKKKEEVALGGLASRTELASHTSLQQEQAITTMLANAGRRGEYNMRLTFYAEHEGSALSWLGFTHYEVHYLSLESVGLPAAWVMDMPVELGSTVKYHDLGSPYSNSVRAILPTGRLEFEITANGADAPSRFSVSKMHYSIEGFHELPYGTPLTIDVDGLVELHVRFITVTRFELKRVLVFDNQLPIVHVDEEAFY